jgi:hypothetical protein
MPKNIYTLTRRRMQRSKSRPRAKEAKKVNSLFPASLLDLHKTVYLFLSLQVRTAPFWMAAHWQNQ